MHREKTIVALSTASGQGAIGIIRLSGHRALEIVSAHTSAQVVDQRANTARFARFSVANELLDEVVITVFRAPQSYTGEDIVEISFHASPFVLSKALESLVASGAELAAPGEFTQRAFMNGKLDLSQAEAVADLIAAESEAEHRLAMHQMRGGFSKEIARLRESLIHFASLIELELDFGEEDVEFANRPQLLALIAEIRGFVGKLIHSFRYGNAVKNGVPVAIIGKPNAGKSTLLNALLNEDRAIVSEIAGTTRDTIEDQCTIDGIRFRFIDTAGLRETTDSIEMQGVQRSLDKMRSAAVVIYLFDVMDPAETATHSLNAFKKELPGTVFLPVANKCDTQKEGALASDIIPISAKLGSGMDELKSALVRTIKADVMTSDVVVTNARHLQELMATDQCLEAAMNGIESGISGELAASDIRQALHHLGAITGEITVEDLLGNIFGKFCIGK